MKKGEGKVTATIYPPLLPPKEARRQTFLVEWMESQGAQCRQLPNGNYQVTFPVRDLATCRSCGAQGTTREFTEKAQGVSYPKCPYCGDCDVAYHYN